MTLEPQDFLGQWQVSRVIEDALTYKTATFSGRAEISDQGDCWLYAEAGHLQMQGAKPMVAERRYLWRAQECSVDIFFEDGRFFHRLELQATAQAAHWCDPDQYDVAYDFSDWPRWRSTWSVVGPKKKYVLKTQYSLAQ